MANYLLRNSLNPNKVVSCTITFRQFIDKNAKDGELRWVIEITTAELNKSGGKIAPVYINHTSETNLDLEIKKATEVISKQIDWEPVTSDIRPPFVSYCNIEEGETVDINSDLVFTIEDILPAAGIDPNSIRVMVNGMDVADKLKITGDPYRYDVRWTPYMRFYEEEEQG